MRLSYWNRCYWNAWSTPGTAAQDAGTEPSAHHCCQRPSPTGQRTGASRCITDWQKQSHNRSRGRSPWHIIQSTNQPRIKQSSAWRYRPIEKISSIEADITHHSCCLQGYQHSGPRIASPLMQCLVNNRLEKTAVFLPVTPGHLKKISQPGTFGNLPSQKAAKEKTTGPTVCLLP